MCILEIGISSYPWLFWIYVKLMSWFWRYPLCTNKIWRRLFKMEVLMPDLQFFRFGKRYNFYRTCIFPYSLFVTWIRFVSNVIFKVMISTNSIAITGPSLSWNRGWKLAPFPMIKRYVIYSIFPIQGWKIHNFIYIVISRVYLKNQFSKAIKN